MVCQYKALWSIPNAGPSVSTFHFGDGAANDATAVAGLIQDMFDAVKAYIPNEASIAFDTELLQIHTVTGELQAVHPVTPPPVVVGTASNAWSAGSGLRMVWQTGDILNGRRVRGSTFFVPTTISAFGTGGQTLPSAGAVFNTAAATLLSGLGAISNTLEVFSRPKPSAAGSIHQVVSGAVSPIPGTLRGRKY